MHNASRERSAASILKQMPGNTMIIPYRHHSTSTQCLHQVPGLGGGQGVFFSLNGCPLPKDDMEQKLISCVYIYSNL